MSMTVLTVDDSRTMREMLRLALADAGFRVVQAEDGLHGLEVLQAEQPQVIVTDINMPRMDGFGFIEEVRGDQRYRAIPILVLTTESDAGASSSSAGSARTRSSSRLARRLQRITSSASPLRPRRASAAQVLSARLP